MMTERIVKKLENKEQARVFAYFLAKEKQRHLKDIRNLDRDLTKLRLKWGVEVPVVNVDVWFEV